MKRFITCLALAFSLFAGNAFADANRAQYVPDIVVTEPGAVQTDIRAYGSNLTDTLINTTIGSTPTTLIISEDTTANGTQMLPATVTLKFVNGAKIILAGGDKLSIKGPIEAGPYQIFDDTDGTTSANYIVFNSNSSLDKVYPQWWGANGFDTTDDLEFIQNAVYAVANNNTGVAGGGYGGYIYYPKGEYVLSDTLYCDRDQGGTPRDGMVHRGESFQETKLTMNSDSNGPVVQFGNGSQSTVSYGCSISNLYINRNTDWEASTNTGEPACIDVNTTPYTGSSMYGVLSTTSCGEHEAVGILVDMSDFMTIDRVFINGDRYMPDSGNGKARLAVGLEIDSSRYGSITNSYIAGCAYQGILSHSENGSNIWCDWAIEENWIIGNGLYSIYEADSASYTGNGYKAGGIVYTKGSNIYYVADNQIYHNYIGIAGDYAAADTGELGKITTNDIDSNLLYGVYMVNTKSVAIYGNWFASNGSGEIGDYAKFGYTIDGNRGAIWLASHSSSPSHIGDAYVIRANFINGGGNSGANLPRSIYVGNNIIHVAIQENAIMNSYYGINAGAADGTTGNSISVLGNAFWYVTYGIGVGAYDTIQYIGNVGTATAVSGTPAAGSRVPWAADYDTLTVAPVDANYGGSLTLSGGTSYEDWLLQPYQNMLNMVVDKAAVTAFQFINSSAGYNTNLLFDGGMAAGIETVAITAAGVAASLNVLTTFVQTDGDGLDTLTLASGTYTGQVKKISCSGESAGGDTWKITGSFADSKTTITFNSANERCELVWDGGSWVVISNNGGTLS